MQISPVIATQAGTLQGSLKHPVCTFAKSRLHCKSGKLAEDGSSTTDSKQWQGGENSQGP
jgi:hypothetical protein